MTPSDPYDSLVAAIKRLPDGVQVLLHLRFVDGLSPREIGEALHLPPEDVSLQLEVAVADLNDLVHPLV